MRITFWKLRGPGKCFSSLSLGGLLFVSFAGVVPAQSFLAGGVQPRLIGTDLAILEAGEARQDLPCHAEPVKPLLGFDLKFHAGYEVTLPMHEIAGQENLLTIVFRVRPVASPENERYFIQRVKVPQIEDDAKGDATLQGQFDLGEGEYKVDWLMRDRAERVCSSSWDLTAELPAKDRQIAMNIAANQVGPSDVEFFQPDPPVMRANEGLLNVKVMINFAPQKMHSAAMKPIDVSALTSILRTIGRDQRIGRFSLVVFNMQDQKVIYRSEDQDCFNFPRIGAALDKLKLGTVDFAKLAVKNSETEFLSGLLEKELTPAEPTDSPYDALVFVGPKVLLDANVPQETLKSVGSLGYPVFYLNYNLYPQQIPWRDSIGHAVRFFRGQEYTISRPRDLWFAVTDMVERIRDRQAKRLNQPAQ
ncbi:MAG: hypothetical protein OHK0021_23120 [Bryobacter sp.]